MYPPIYEVAAADATVKSVLGSPPRLYLFGEAPPNVPKPYAVWRVPYGTPENYLGQAPDMDNFGAQIDVYGATATACRGVAKALRDALEPVAYVVSWNGESRDPVTRDYNYSFTVEFMEPR